MRAEYAQHLMFHGILIFLIGLLMGFCLFFGVFPNGRIGLVAHLEGVMNGMFLAIVGLLWHRLSLSAGQQRLTLGLALSAVYLNIFQAVWWAFLGRSTASPVFPADRPPFAIETLIMNVVLPALSIAFVGCCLMLLWGLRRGMAMQRASPAARPEVL